MDSAQEFIDGFLAHYKSEYYDPVKAHEYYMRTRELKGREKGKGLSEKGLTTEQKKVWGYSKIQIGKAQQNELKRGAQTNRTTVEKARKKADARRQVISDKLARLMKSLQEKSQQESNQLSELYAVEAKRIAEETSRKIAALPPIPKGVSKEKRSELVTQRKAELARIRGEAGAMKSDLFGRVNAEAQTRADRSNNAMAKGKATASADRDRVNSELKATIGKARANYESLKAKLKAKYERKSQKEFEAIKEKVSSP